MKAAAPSRTAEYMALFRALESSQPGERRLFADRSATAFLSPPLRAVALGLKHAHTIPSIYRLATLEVALVTSQE